MFIANLMFGNVIWTHDLVAGLGLGELGRAGERVARCSCARRALVAVEERADARSCG